MLVRARTTGAPLLPNNSNAVPASCTTSLKFDITLCSGNACVSKSVKERPAAATAFWNFLVGEASRARTRLNPVPMVDARIPELASVIKAACVPAKVTPMSRAIGPT